MSSEDGREFVIVGGGSAGITVASRLLRNLSDPDVLVIEPSEDHFYQPMWTLNGAGIGSPDATRRDQADVTPAGADWLQDAARTIDPEDQSITTENGETIRYEYLVLAPGIQLDWDAIPGLEGNVGEHGICSNYAYDTVRTTEKILNSFDGGTALFTMPDTPVKCPGAPQKIVYLADEVFRKNGVRDESEIVFSLPGDDIFGIEKYAKPLRCVIDRKDIDPRYGTCLDTLKPEEQKAVIEDLESGETTTVDYDMIHVTPPQSAPDFLETTGLTDEDGWVDVDKQTLQHTKYDNVFALGDASSLPPSKTAAAVRKQAPDLVRNLLDIRSGQEPSANYNGYTACPLVTGFGSVVMAEFNYDGNPEETFPFDQGKERRTMWWVKRYLLPLFYWYIMLKGRG